MKSYIFILITLIMVIAVSSQPYNTTLLEDAENPYEYSLAINTLLEGIIGIAFLLIVFVVAFSVNSANGGMYDGLLAAGWITSLSAVILLPLGFISNHIFGFVIVLTALISAMSYFFGGK
jgi:hypothetical protein